MNVEPTGRPAANADLKRGPSEPKPTVATAEAAAPAEPAEEEAIRVTFVPTADELLALGLHVNRPEWQDKPGRRGPFWTMIGVALLPLAAAACFLPFDHVAAAVVAGVGSFFTAPLIPFAVLYRRGGPWLDAFRRRRLLSRLKRNHAAGGLTTTARTTILSPAGAAEESAGCVGFRGWPRVLDVDRVPTTEVSPPDVAGGETVERGGEMLVVTAVAGGPRPVCFFVPRRAVPGGAAYRRLADWVEDWASAARGADPADPRYTPPPPCRPADDADGQRRLSVEFAPIEQDALDASLAARVPPSSREAMRGLLILGAAAAVGPVMAWADQPVALSWIVGTQVVLGAVVFLAHWLQVRGWPGGLIRRHVKAQWEADLTFAEPETFTINEAGVAFAGSAFGAFRPWEPTTAVRVAGGPPRGPFALLPTLHGVQFFVSRRAFNSDKEFRAFVTSAERLRTGVPDPSD